MKFDTIIIGGGLSGLVCGIRLQKAGQKCAIVSTGQSALHFSSGYLDLLDRTSDGQKVTEPLQAIGLLEQDHPYRKIGKEKLQEYIGGIKEFFGSCGIILNGNPLQNGFRITPTGKFKTTWLTLQDFSILPSESLPWKKVLIANFQGFLDFNTAFIAQSIEEKGTACSTGIIRMEEMERLRKNPTEMRSTNIARVLEDRATVDKAVRQIKGMLSDEDAVILPAVFGLKDASMKEQIEKALGREVFIIATMPPSVPGIRTQMRLKSEFENAGGVFLAGDTACDPEIQGGRVTSIGTVNFGDIRLSAGQYVLATGSFFSKGLYASPDRVTETVFGLDVEYTSGRASWYNTAFFSRQDYISFGVRTDSTFRCFKDGKLMANLYAIGSVLAGSNTLYEGCGAGTAIFSAMNVADRITRKID